MSALVATYMCKYSFAMLVLTHTLFVHVTCTCTYTHLTQVCQNEEESGTQHFSLGKKVAVNWTISSMSPLSFTIAYTGGDSAGQTNRYLLTCHLKQAYVAYYGCLSFLFHFRQSIITFSHSKDAPSIVYKSEDTSTSTYVSTSNSLSHMCNMVCFLCTCRCIQVMSRRAYRELCMVEKLDHCELLEPQNRWKQNRTQIHFFAPCRELFCTKKNKTTNC